MERNLETIANKFDRRLKMFGCVPCVPTIIKIHSNFGLIRPTHQECSTLQKEWSKPEQLSMHLGVIDRCRTLCQEVSGTGTQFGYHSEISDGMARANPASIFGACEVVGPIWDTRICGRVSLATSRGKLCTIGLVTRGYVRYRPTPERQVCMPIHVCDFISLRQDTQ